MFKKKDSADKDDKKNKGSAKKPAKKGGNPFANAADLAKKKK